MSWSKYITTLLLCLTFVACGESENNEPQSCGTEGTRCAASDWPQWQLKDIQPKSDKFEQTYGLDSFRGKTVVVAFLVGWCPYCRAQAIKLEEMKKELGENVQIVIVHGKSANTKKDQDAMLYMTEADGSVMKDGQDNPISRCTMPVFQDTDADDVWGKHEGGKDDFYIYNTLGQLTTYMKGGKNLSEEAGYAEVKKAIKDAK